MHVNADRLWSRLHEMAQIGATEGGGVERLALSPQHFAARAKLMEWAREIGLSGQTDAIGNLFLSPENGSERRILLGSHLDTQPAGGRYDGAYGVVAALEVLHTIAENDPAAVGDYAVVDWTNEEGCRFAPGVMGSATYVEPARLASNLAAQDKNGVSVAEAVRQWQESAGLPLVELARPYAAYLEAHIEQGPILEVMGKAIGVVTSIQGIKRYRIQVFGENGHAGTVPREMRRDSLMAAVRVINYLNSTPAGMSPDIRFTIGRMETKPGSPAVIPGYTEFSIDLRHQKAEVIDKMDYVIRRLPKLDFGPCAVVVHETAEAPPRVFHPKMIEIIEKSVGKLGYAHMDIVSGAGHDAQCLAPFCPSGMIFIPCKNGISHNEQEDINKEHSTMGANVLLEAAVVASSRGAAATAF